MPWKETYVMDQKIQMISHWLSGDYSITELSRIYGVSRKTLYKWIARYQKNRENGLKDLTSKPATLARATPTDTVKDILILKNRYSKWGARKVLSRLK